MTDQPKACPVCGGPVNPMALPWCKCAEVTCGLYGAWVPVPVWNRLTLTPEADAAVMEAAVAVHDEHEISRFFAACPCNICVAVRARREAMKGGKP